MDNTTSNETETQPTPQALPGEDSVDGLFGLCRDCKHWMPTALTRANMSDDYPRDRHPDDGWHDGVCNRIKRGIQITASGGWEGATVDSVETDANFGCRFFEPNAEMSHHQKPGEKA